MRCSVRHSGRRRADRDTPCRALRAGRPRCCTRRAAAGFVRRLHAAPGCFYRVKVAYRGEDTPQHVIHFGQRLTQIFSVRPTLRDHAFYRRAAVVQRLRNGWNHMLREDFRKRWQRKGVSNGLVINAVLLNLMNEARIRRCAYGSVMGLSVEDFNAGRCAFAAVETFCILWRYALFLPDGATLIGPTLTTRNTFIHAQLSP